MIGSAARVAAPLLLIALAAPAAGYVDHPIPGYDGGPGRPNCRECHLHAPEKAARGRLEMAGLPARYEPGRAYALVLTLTYPGLKRAGFQAAVRAADGLVRDAGRWVVDNDRVERSTDDAGTPYAQHAPAGVTPQGADHTAWAIVWRAPDAAAGPLVVSVAANAANGDESALGDVILLRQITVDGPVP